MVELDKLPLILCTETIESISLSGSYKLTSDTHNGLVAKYRKIAAKNPNLSLSDLFQQQIGSKNTEKAVIPHWIGGRGGNQHSQSSLLRKDYATE